MRLRSKKALATLVAAVGVAIAYFGLTPFALPGVLVDAGVCDESPTTTDTSVQSSWSGASYRLAVDQPENCGVVLGGASVQRLGSHLFVRTKFHSPSGMRASCYCRHQIALNIPDLPRQAFRVHVYSWP